MAVLSFHCENYKKGALNGLDGHNRRLHKSHKSNPDINPEFTKYNKVYKAPQKSLYSDCQKLIQQKVLANGNKVRKDSNYITECIFTYPSDLPPERLSEYNRLVIQYMNNRLNPENLVEAVCHVDEGGQPHLHLDYVLITQDNRLSSKSLITRDFITSVHDELPKFLQQYGFDIQRGESVPERQAGRSASQYKKDMERQKKALDDKEKVLNQKEAQLTTFANRSFEMFSEGQEFLEQSKKLFNTLTNEQKRLYQKPIIKLDESLITYSQKQEQKSFTL